MISSIGSDDRFRAVLTCTKCGNVILTGPWTTGDRAMAAYNLGRAPAGVSAAVLEHLQVAGHAVTVTFEEFSAEVGSKTS